MVKVTFYSLTGAFKSVKSEEFETEAKALEAVRAYAEPAGFTNVKIVEEDDMCSIRFTAKTPGGRGGRNVATGDLGPSDEPW